MAEIAVENGRISKFEGLVTLTLTLDWVILHTVQHHSSTSTYMPNLIEIKLFVDGRTYRRTHGRTFETGFIRSALSKSRPKKDSFILVKLSEQHGQTFVFYTFRASVVMLYAGRLNFTLSAVVIITDISDSASERRSVDEGKGGVTRTTLWSSDWRCSATWT